MNLKMNTPEKFTEMKPILYATLGLPGSGKSTWARKTVKRYKDEHGLTAVETCKDDIREELHGGVWSKENEREVVSFQTEKIKNALLSGMDVFVHDTNFNQVKRLNALAKECKADIVWVHFTEISIEECIARDAKRTGKSHVGEEVIRRMAKQAGLM